MDWKDVAVAWAIVVGVCFILFRFSGCVAETDKVDLERHRASVAANAEIERVRLEAERRGVCVCH